MSFEELKRYDAFDEDSAKEFIDRNYSTKTMSAFCDSISHDLPYIDTPHAKLLDMMKLAQLDTLNSSINLSAMLIEERDRANDGQATISFALQGFCGDIPFTLALNDAQQFTLQYALVDRRGYSDYVENKKPTEYDLDVTDPSITFAELGTFLYSILRQNTIGADPDKKPDVNAKLMLAAIEQPNYYLLGKMIEEIGNSHGTYIEERIVDTEYPDTLDRSIQLKLTTTEHPNRTEQMVDTNASYFPIAALSKMAHKITINKRSMESNLPVDGELKPVFEVAVSVDNKPAQSLEPSAIPATIDGLAFMQANTTIALDQDSLDPPDTRRA